jgi:hypothetical protein
MQGAYKRDHNLQMEKVFYDLLFRADPTSVPQCLKEEETSTMGYVVHELLLELLSDLNHEPAPLRLLVMCFESATDCVRRVLYLVGLMAALGIVHGTIAGRTELSSSVSLPLTVDDQATSS